MSDGQIIARHYQTGAVVRVAWASGIIQRVEPAQEKEARWIAPALADLQVNGFAGVDFQGPATLPEMLKAARALRAAGCVRFLPTLITAPWGIMLERLRALRRLRSDNAELLDAIAGWHLEGPFLSPEPGYCGAHDPSVMCDPAPSMIEELREATEGDPVLLTLAPERKGAMGAIRRAVSLGMKVSLGHTNASQSILCEAVEAGASGFTHLGNACPQALDRHDNILWRTLDLGQLAVSLIPDKLHVSPQLFRLIHRLLERKSILYTTDAMSAAGAEPGRHRIGPLELEVGPDGVARFPGRTNFAGSALRPIEGVFRAAEMLGCAWNEVWDSFSTQPARFMGIPHGLEPGLPAAFCVLDGTDPSQGIATWTRGRKDERFYL